MNDTTSFLKFDASPPAFSLENWTECSGKDFVEAFDVHSFTEAVAIAAEKLRNVLEQHDIKGVTLQSPQVLTAAARALMCGEKNSGFEAKRFADTLDLYLNTCIRVGSRGYMGRQFSSVVPVSAVFDLVSALAPQPASYYEAGQLANVADKIMAEEFAPFIGWPANSFDMVTTSGASLANLTAVLAARNQKLGPIWTKGLETPIDGKRPAIAIGEDAHYSVVRLGGILGIGQDQVIRLPLNSQHQICPVRAEQRIEAAKQCGLNVFCLVASAGTTAVGAIDPLTELAILARKHSIWFHVDAAHGGALLVSDRLRSRLQGLEMADSFCLDAHKMLFVPALCTLLFYRNRSAAAAAFPHRTASYVADPFDDEISHFQSGSKNFECTKRASILNLWLVWALFGRCFFEGKINHLIDMTSEIYAYLRSLPDFEVVHNPEINILCFRHCPHGLQRDQHDTFQFELRDRVRKGGRYFVSAAVLNGKAAMRLVLMNHEITLQDVAGLVREIRGHAQNILHEQASPVPPSKWQATSALPI